MPPEAEFWDPRITLPSGIRDATMLFERELARRSCCSTMPNLSRFMGMVEQHPEFICILLPSTLGNTDSESSSDGSCHPARERNMLHLSSNRTVVGGEEDYAYSIPRTLGSRQSMSKSISTVDALVHSISTPRAH